MHCTAVFSEQFPQGDQGGNKCWVQSASEPMNLHMFWDGLWNRETARDPSKSFNSLGIDDLDMLKVPALAGLV